MRSVAHRSPTCTSRRPRRSLSPERVQAPTLTGSLRVDRGSIYLADADLARKLAVEEVPDSTTTSAGSSGSEFLSTLITNLQVNDVTISLGDNVRLRSSEANVRLSGQLNLVTWNGTFHPYARLGRPRAAARVAGAASDRRWHLRLDLSDWFSANSRCSPTAPSTSTGRRRRQRSTSRRCTT